MDAPGMIFPSAPAHEPGSGLQMTRIFSSRPSKGYVINPSNKLVAGASRLYMATPSFVHVDRILSAVKCGRPEECPPMNGRMAMALRSLRFSVRGV